MFNKETTITCPKCKRCAVFAATITHKAQNIADRELYPQLDMNCIVLTCQGCNTQLQFVVDLQPSFTRGASACSSST